MNELLMEELENDAFLDKVYGRRDDDEDAEPEWELVSLDDLDEQQQMEIAASGQKVCVNCKREQARWDSLYCSDRCRKAFLNFGEVA